MPDASNPNSTDEPQAADVTNVSGGVTIDAQRDVTIRGDVVGRDKIVGYTVEQVNALLAQISRDFQPKLFDGRCPYLGLEAFTEDDADRFFGRETLVSELVARVKASRCVVIAGPSGSGKSSLVRAGLIHALKQGALPASQSDRWLYATLTPGRHPIEALALAVSRLAKSPGAGDYLRNHQTEVDALHRFAESVLSDRKDQRAVIFVDQFEEVFTQVSKEDERIAFLNLLTCAATTEGGRVTVLFAMRSDFVPNCATYPQLNALLNQQFMQVGAMQPDELVSAIARPALQVGLRFDPDLVAQIVNEMQDEPGALPLMQFALKDLFDAQQARGGVMALTLNDYLARGGLRKALERHANAAFARLSEDEQQLARTIFCNLIGIGRNHQDTRRTVTLAELVPANQDVSQIKTVVQKLENARLLTTGEKDNQYTIAHETLLDAWPWLRQLVDDNREAIALQNQISEDARRWNENQHDASYLYRGRVLADVEQWSLTHGHWLTASEWSFLRASQTARQRTRVWRAFAGGVAVALALVALGLALTESGPFQPRWVWRQVPGLANVEVLSVLWTGDDVVYAGMGHAANGALVARSRDGGVHWEYLNLPGTEVWALIAGQDGALYASLGAAGLVRSDDGGDNWHRIGATLPITQVAALASTPDGALYIGDNLQASGVLVSRDRGDTWVRETGVPTMPVYSLAWSDSGLLAGTARDVWIKSADGSWQRLPFYQPVVYGLGGLNENIFASSLVSGLLTIRLVPPAQLTVLQNMAVSSLETARQPYERVVTAAPLRVVVLEWRVRERQLRQIADSKDLANAALLNVVALHDDVWVGANNGLHRGRLLHWYEPDGSFP